MLMGVVRILTLHLPDADVQQTTSLFALSLRSMSIGMTVKLSVMVLPFIGMENALNKYLHLLCFVQVSLIGYVEKTDKTMKMSVGLARLEPQ